jgi:hypothetical protein
VSLVKRPERGSDDPVASATFLNVGIGGVLV